MTFYVTFGCGTICKGNFLICYAPDEETLRERLNADMKIGWLPKWAGIYENIHAVLEHSLVPLATAYEAPTQHCSGPCRKVASDEPFR